MSSAHQPQDDQDYESDEAAMLDPEEAGEVIEDDGDAAMDSGDDEMGEGEGGEDQEMIQEEIAFQNDSVAHFDGHHDSIFCIAQHPRNPAIVATGGSEGEDKGGEGYIWDSTPVDRPLLPREYQADPNEMIERRGQDALFKLEGHTDSINCLAFTYPNGDALLSGGLDGKLRAYVPTNKDATKWKFLAETQEVEEVNWLEACPNPMYPNTIALGGNDGSVWVYTIDPSNPADALQIVQSYFIHTSSCTAGAWSPDGKLLCTVSDESSLYVWDVFGEAAAAGVQPSAPGSQALVSLTAEDQRFAVEGGLYSVAVAPTGAFLVTGGAHGAIKVVSLPRLTDTATTTKGAVKGKATKKAAGAAGGVPGTILADLSAQTDGVETLAFAPAPSTLLAAGSVDGSIALFDSAYRFAVRRHIKEAHEEFSVVKVEFSKSDPRLLTSVGMDGVVRRWNTQGGTAVANSGFVQEWRGHRGEGERGGILGFVQGHGDRIVTGGDDGIALVFEVPQQ
jgi:ribosome assembly protein SQT1